ncbi:collagenase 3-like [Dreissena polymorpha]|uniref:Peptidase metallopeptidase domain-containing protein n=1 Tax=Dreissena polymorpha TaxID=45954 RepID=A0A9D4CDF6_DREPO|nr:collagenase 3-like [Dreissena polymorpha]KAH3721423.1 hypothetical protein DPMN_064345 [Dreissena polymorpha]
MKENRTVMKTLLGLFLLGVQAFAPGTSCSLPNCPNKTQAYLTEFGYLNPDKSCTEDDLRAALTQFQSMNIGFNNLTVTGECDTITVAVMGMPRCGCEDIVKGNKPKVMQPPANLIGPQPYTLGMTKWGKRTLTWLVEKYPVRNRHLTNAQIDDAMKRGLDIWAQKTQLTFQRVTTKPADIVISFETRRHEPIPPYYDFDGPGNVLAHAFFPESGVVHFDDDESYVLGNDGGTELYIVAAHEFGHTLGISHSNVHEALMAPYYRYSTKLELHHDDVSAIQSLYGYQQNTPAPITNAPTRPPPPTQAPVYPPYCDISVDGAFQIDGVTYMFTQVLDNGLLKTFVYTVTAQGINEQKTAISEMFTKNSNSRYRGRAYPYRIDAAAYIPDRRYAFLFVGTRTYRYTKGQDGRFYLDEGYPKWMDVSEFPERPRAAVAMPYTRSKAHYMLIFGSTMVWDWNFGSDRVGAWAYPIDVFGRNMPQQVDAAYLDTTISSSNPSVIFIKGKEYFKFSVAYRRVMAGDENRSLKKDIFKRGCM